MNIGILLTQTVEDFPFLTSILVSNCTQSSINFVQFRSSICSVNMKNMISSPAKYLRDSYYDWVFAREKEKGSSVIQTYQQISYRTFHRIIFLNLVYQKLKQYTDIRMFQCVNSGHTLFKSFEIVKENFLNKSILGTIHKYKYGVFH